MLFIYLTESSHRPSFTSSGQIILTPFPWWLLYAFSFLFTSLVPFSNLSLLAYDLCPYFMDLHSYVLQEPARCSTIRGPCSWEQPLTSSLPCISLSSHSSNCLSKSSTFSLTRSLHHLLQNLLSYTNALCVSFFSVSLTQAYSSWSGISGIWTFKGGHYCLSISTSLVPELCWACGVSWETSFLFFSFFSCFPWEASLWFCEKQCRARGQLVMR